MGTRCDRYVIVELDGSGHRFWYVSLLIHWLVDNVVLPDISLITTHLAQGRPEWDEFMGANLHASRLNVVLVEDPRATMDAIATLQREEMARLVITDGDRWLARLVTAMVIQRLKPRGSILIMRPYRAHGIRGAARHFTKRALMTTIGVLTNDFSVLKLAPNGSPVPDRNWVNDPVEFHPRDVTRPAWYEFHGLALDRRYLVVLGDLSHRKFILELVDAFDRQFVDDWHLMLVGRLDAPERNYFATHSTPTRVSVIEGFISDEDFDTWIDQADAVAVLYRNEGASGVLGKCAVAGVPVLVGGTKSVLDSARLLDLPRSEISRVDAARICEALTYLPRRGAMAPHLSLRAGSEDFASRLLRG
jgi:hypothetical protein